MVYSRIVRLPSDVPGEESQRANDKYVAIMGAGLANNNLCAGSSVFAIELEYVSSCKNLWCEINSGPMTIIDTDPSGVTGNNVIPTAMEVILIMHSNTPIVLRLILRLVYLGGVQWFTSVEGKYKN